MRRVLFLAATASGLAGVAVLAALVFVGGGTTDPEPPDPLDTLTGGLRGGETGDPADHPETDGSETTGLPGSSPVESPGAAPVDGALLSRFVGDPDEASAVDVGEGTDCAALDPDLELTACTRVVGSAGHFLVLVGVHADGARQARLYAAARTEGTDFVPWLETERFARDVEVFGIRLDERDVDGEPVVVVEYEFGGSGSVSSFDVVAWEDGMAGPGPVAVVHGTGMDRYAQEGRNLRFVSANYDDGAPTCCPNFAAIRTLSRDGAGEWNLVSEVVPFSEAP